MASVKRRVVETVWFDPVKLEVSCIAVREDGIVDEGHQEEIVNAITTDEAGVRKLEFFLRDAETKDRHEWSVPKSHTLATIAKCFEKCNAIKAKESEASEAQ